VKHRFRFSRNSNSGEGFDFVRCRICGDHRRVLSARHLSKHGTDREEYMDEYGLSPDQLIAKDFRIIQSSRRGYQPYGEREWIAAIKKIHKSGGRIGAADLQHKNHTSID
jgi:ROS/MUCR transcriptional regulator protein